MQTRIGGKHCLFQDACIPYSIKSMIRGVADLERSFTHISKSPAQHTLQIGFCSSAPVKATYSAFRGNSNSTYGCTSIYLYMFYEDAIDGTVLRVVRPLAYLVIKTERGTGRLPMYACQACQANMESKINQRRS